MEKLLTPRNAVAAAVVVGASVIAILAAPNPGESAGETGPWYSILPPLLAVTVAIVTSRILASLVFAVVVVVWMVVVGPVFCRSRSARRAHSARNANSAAPITRTKKGNDGCSDSGSQLASRNRGGHFRSPHFAWKRSQSLLHAGLGTVGDPDEQGDLRMSQ